MVLEVKTRSSTQFEKSWLPWIALRHFLPAASTRALCATMVCEMSGGLLSIEDIVEDRLGGGDVFMEAWAIRPKTCSTRLASYLLGFVQRIVWQNDKPMWSDDESIKNEAALSPLALQFAFDLGGSDLVHLVSPLPEDGFVQQELKALFDAISLCSSRSDISASSEVADLIKDIDAILIDINLQLRIAILKHLGDLYCDYDRWLAADELYTRARAELSQLAESERQSSFALAMRTTINQSLAASAAVNIGYDRAQTVLANLLSDSQGEVTLAVSNASLDEYVARVRSRNELFPEDTRGATLIAPLLADSHKIEHALTSWQTQDFPLAESWFWSVLRRQISLGQLAASKTTKGYFACCLVDHLCSQKPYSVDTFKLTVSLLIESENSDRAKHIRWSEDLLDSVVDEGICQYIIDHAEMYNGVRKHRRAVAVVLFSEWACKISAARRALAAMMLRYLIRIGSDLNAGVIKDGADFKTCFSAVLDICERRPELRHDIRDELAEVLARRIGDAGYWTGEEIALRLAAECASAFTEEGLKRVVRAVLALLGKTDPSPGNWVIAKPAIQLLGEVSVATLAEGDLELGQDILRAVLKFNGSESGGAYAADIIFSLNQYPRIFLRSRDVDDQYKPVIAQALEKASNVNASSAVNNMMALLVAPRAAGYEAIASVLQILHKLVESAVSGKAALSFGPAYTPLRYLVAYRTEICEESGMPVEEMARSLANLCRLVQTVWHSAIGNPTIFAPLALLREQAADRVTVHNWVIASLELAEVVERLDAVRGAIEAARNQRQLSDGISLGFATRHAGGTEGDVDSSSMDNESRGAFYAAIGRRLSALQRNEDRIFTTKLVKSTLRHGPRQVDAAVFASISPQDVDDLRSLKLGLEEYEARIGDDRELSLTLNPLVQRWKQASAS
jgi:hypothetical protein